MKKNLPEAKEENRLEESAFEMKQNAAGNKIIRYMPYLIIFVVILLALYFVSNYNSNTFNINL